MTFSQLFLSLALSTTTAFASNAQLTSQDFLDLNSYAVAGRTNSVVEMKLKSKVLASCRINSLYQAAGYECELRLINGDQVEIRSEEVQSLLSTMPKARAGRSVTFVLLSDQELDCTNYSSEEAPGFSCELTK